MSATAPRRGPRVPLVSSVPDDPPVIDPIRAALTPSLDAAVMRVQAAAPALVRNATGQIQSRTYGYVTLGAVVDVVLPLLVDAGLLWKVWPTCTDDGRPALRYRMTHIQTGESDEDVMPLPCEQTMQGLGSAITYGRRYALSAYLNLTIDEDDDGAAANSPSTRHSGGQNAESNAESNDHQNGAGEQVAAQPTARPAAKSQRPCSAKQRAMLQARAREADLTAGQFANVILLAAGDETRTWETNEAAMSTLSRLLDRLPWPLVDPVLAAITERST